MQRNPDNGYVLLTKNEAVEIVTFLERVVPHGPAEATALHAYATGLDPKAGEHDR